MKPFGKGCLLVSLVAGLAALAAGEAEPQGTLIDDQMPSSLMRGDIGMPGENGGGIPPWLQPGGGAGYNPGTPIWDGGDGFNPGGWNGGDGFNPGGWNGGDGFNPGIIDDGGWTPSFPGDIGMPGGNGGGLPPWFGGIGMPGGGGGGIPPWYQPSPNPGLGCNDCGSDPLPVPQPLPIPSPGGCGNGSPCQLAPAPAPPCGGFPCPPAPPSPCGGGSCMEPMPLPQPIPWPQPVPFPPPSCGSPCPMPTPPPPSCGPSPCPTPPMCSNDPGCLGGGWIRPPRPSPLPDWRPIYNGCRRKCLATNTCSPQITSMCNSRPDYLPAFPMGGAPDFMPVQPLSNEAMPSYTSARLTMPGGGDDMSSFTPYQPFNMQGMTPMYNQQDITYGVPRRVDDATANAIRRAARSRGVSLASPVSLPQLMGSGAVSSFDSNSGCGEGGCGN